MDKISSLGMPTHPKKYPRGTSIKACGCPEAPLLHRQKSGHLSKHYIFIALCIIRFSWSVSCFCFQFSFVLLAAINGLITLCCFGERLTPFFIAKNTLIVTLIVQRVFSFSATAFSSCFLP
jgi:hypothetical protein